MTLGPDRGHSHSLQWTLEEPGSPHGYPVGSGLPYFHRVFRIHNLSRTYSVDVANNVRRADYVLGQPALRMHTHTYTL